MSELDPEQTAAVLEQIADYSADENIREDIRKVIRTLRGNGLIFMNGPPQGRRSGERRRL